MLRKAENTTPGPLILSVPRYIFVFIFFSFPCLNPSPCLLACSAFCTSTSDNPLISTNVVNRCTHHLCNDSRWFTQKTFPKGFVSQSQYRDTSVVALDFSLPSSPAPVIQEENHTAWDHFQQAIAGTIQKKLHHNVHMIHNEHCVSELQCGVVQKYLSVSHTFWFLVAQFST